MGQAATKTVMTAADYLAWEAGRRFGVMGMASAYVLVVGCWSLPVSGYLAWRHWKRVEG